MDREAAQKHLARLIALCDAAGVAGAGFEKHALSEDEKKLLHSCADTGVFRLQGADDFPSLWLEVKESNGDWSSLGKDNLPKAAITLSAFEKLCRRGYVQHSGEAEFILTGEGFKVATKEQRKLRDQQARKETLSSTFKAIATFVLVIFVLLVLLVIFSSSL